MTKKEKMYQRIEKHGRDLLEVFGLDCEPVQLCKRLRRLELKANRICCDLCNGDIDQDDADKQLEAIEKSLIKIIGKENAGKVFINRDPRGYALKMTEDESKKHRAVHRDFGGYVILAPDFS